MVGYLNLFAVFFCVILEKSRIQMPQVLGIKKQNLLVGNKKLRNS